jgi:hypothetical protein
MSLRVTGSEGLQVVKEGIFRVLATASMKVASCLLSCRPCNLVETDGRFRGDYVPLYQDDHRPYDGDSKYH